MAIAMRSTGERRVEVASWRRLKLEGALIALLVVTCAALFFQDAVLTRTLTFSPGGPQRFGVAWHADEGMHGRSEVFTDAARPLRWSCDLRAGYDYAFCGYELTFDGARYQHGLNLSDYDAVSIDLDYHGAQRSARFYLKNADPRYSRAGQGDTTKFNRVEVALHPGRQTVHLNLSDFSVAEWWILNNSIPPELSRTQVNNVVAIEIETGTKAPLGRYSFDVKNIQLHGRAVSQADWYLAILACWALLVLAFLGVRVASLKSDLAARRVLQTRAQDEAVLARRTARTDHLTGLFNRAGLIEAYAGLHAHGPRAAALLIIDVDHFKAVNDRFGHGRGDAVLSEVASCLAERLGDDGVVGRWGGEEFLAVLPGATMEMALATAERLRAGVKELQPQGCDPVTVSIGVSQADVAPGDLPVLLSQADVALYRAKHDGRDRVRCHRPMLRRAA